MGSRRSIRLKETKKTKSEVIHKTIDFNGKKISLSFASEFDLIISALGISLLALDDPKVNAILKQFGIQFFDEDGNQVGGEK